MNNHSLNKQKKSIFKTYSKEQVSIFDNTNGNAIFTLDKRGIIQIWSKSAEKLTNYKENSVIGKNYSLLFCDDEIKKKIPENILKIASKKNVSKSENRCIRNETKLFWASIVVNSVKDKKGNLKYFILIMEDITKKKEIERQKDEYIGIASHELRTPISSLSLYSELLAERLNLDADKKTLQIFQDIKGQIGRLVNLVDDLLIVNEIERDKLTINKIPFDLNLLLKKVIHNFQASTASHKIVFKSLNKGKVQGDQARVTQVLVNLIANGIKYSPKSNKIIVSCVYERDQAVVSIQDFGSGISLNDQKSIFRRYFRSYSLDSGNLPGIGLGLYISKKIIDQHHQKLWVKSKIGKGSIFFFSLSRVMK